MKTRLATLAVGFGMVFATSGPAVASECEIVTQEAHRVSGVWSTSSGPLVTVTPSGAGLAWITVAGATLDLVQMETVPTEVGGATISAAVTLPGTERGTISIAGDDDLVVHFTGSSACAESDLGDAVVELVEVEATESVAVASRAVVAPVVALPAPTARHLCRLVTYAA